MMDRLLQYKDNDNDNEIRSFINESIFDIFDEWFDQQSNHHQHASFDRVMKMMIRYCRPKEFLLISLEKLSITATVDMFRSLLLSIYDVYIKLEQNRLLSSSFFKDLVNATSKTLGQLILHTANIDIDIVYMYLDFLNKLMTFVGDLHEENLIVLETTLVDLVSRLVIFSYDRRRDLIVQVIKTMYSQDVSIMEILSLNRDKTHLCRDGLTMIASVMMIDYAQGGNLLPRVYSKKYMWTVLLSHLEGVRAEESGCEFIKSLKGILYNYNDKSFMNPFKMMSIIDSADLTNQYDIHCWEHVGYIKRILTVISVADQLTRNEVLVVIRFILLMYDKRSLLLLLQQLIVEFDNVPSVAALFIDFLKDMIQHLPYSNVDNFSNDLTVDTISPFSYQSIYDTFVANIFSKIVSDECGEWVLAHLDIISATITLAHCIVLRAKQKSGNNNIKDFKVAAMATRVALNKFTVQRNDELKMQLLQHELDYLV